jgi:hypothetical protein
VSVIGSIQASESSPPSWICYLDGNIVPSDGMVSINTTLNDVVFFSLYDIVPKATPSNLTVVASGTADYPFLFDLVQYEPDASVILDNATVVVNPTDGHIAYSSGWSITGWVNGVSVQGTSVQGSFLNFDFVGAFRL